MSAEGGPFLTFILPGAQLAPPPSPVSYATAYNLSAFIFGSGVLNLGYKYP